MCMYVCSWTCTDSNSYLHISGKGTTSGSDYFNASFVDVSYHVYIIYVRMYLVMNL